MDRKSGSLSLQMYTQLLYTRLTGLKIFENPCTNPTRLNRCKVMYVGCDLVPVDVLSHMIMQAGLKYLSVARNIL